MNPADQFQQSITPNATSNGIVLGISGNALRVQTSTGIITVDRGIQTDINTGDSVKIANNSVVGRLRREANVPTYYL